MAGPTDCWPNCHQILVGGQGSELDICGITTVGPHSGNGAVLPISFTFVLLAFTLLTMVMGFGQLFGQSLLLLSLRHCLYFTEDKLKAFFKLHSAEDNCLQAFFACISDSTRLLAAKSALLLISVQV